VVSSVAHRLRGTDSACCGFATVGSVEITESAAASRARPDP